MTYANGFAALKHPEAAISFAGLCGKLDLYELLVQMLPSPYKGWFVFPD